MKRVFVLALVMMFAVAVSAQAQGRPDSSKSSTAVSAKPAGGIFGKASIDAAVSKTIAATPPPRAHRSFWRSPWPWIIGVAAVILIVAFAGGSPSTGMGIY